MKQIIFLFLFVFLISNQLLAQEEKSGSILLGMDNDLLAYNLTITGEGDSKDKEHSFGLAIGNPLFGLNLGYKLNDNMVLGANFGFGFSYLSESDINVINFRISPMFEYMFSHESKIRPFLKISFDVFLSRAGDDDGDSLLVWMLGCTGSGGMHIFVAESFSIDLSIAVAFRGGKYDDISDIKNFKAGGVLGISGWF